MYCLSRYALCLFCSLAMWGHISAMVKYDEGRLEINGVHLLQDSQNPNLYYYIPPYPRLSRLPNGDFEFFCIKYVGTKGKEDSGGLLHALIQFSLTEDEKQALETALKERFPEAVLMGAVPMMEDDEEGSVPSFRLVSSIISEGDTTGFSTHVITSGRAPLIAGSKAAIAAELTADGATLLWESFSGPTSDVSVVVEGYYQALVRAYHARITANLELVYDHFSSFQNKQGGFSRDQTRDAIDSLAQAGMIDIHIADMSDAYDVDSKIFADLVTIITEKVVDLMFNVNKGWAKMPDLESGVVPDDIKGRYENGAFVSFFFGDGGQPYVPDDQLVLKSKSEIRNFKFALNLTQSTVIKVPVFSAGNIGGFYERFKEDKKYFRVVDMNDPSFQSRDLFFQVDGNYIDAFGEVIDHASIRIRKEYSDSNHHPYTGTILFNRETLEAGRTIQSVSYKRLGGSDDSWLDYQYKIGWKLLGRDSTIMMPKGGWEKVSLSSVSIQPPFQKREIVIEIDQGLFLANRYQSARVRFASILCGKPYQGQTIVLRSNDTGESVRTNVYHDAKESIVYQVSWYGGGKKVEDELKILDDDYLYLVPPPIEN